ncbi:MAG: hypothetical protein IJ287_07485 [Methanobrevibacter sp.]|nr:hypothetical protein [Methanobrevibacter sp.]
MENKNIIIILIAIIIVLAAVVGMLYMQSINAKEPTIIKITSNETQNEGGKLTMQLMGLSKTAISKEKVNITITDSEGKVVVNQAVKTNSKGKAKLDLDLKKGEYNVTVTFGGNEKYAENNTVQKLSIKEETQHSSSEENSVDMSLYSGYSSKIGSYRVVENQQELGLLETPDGNYYVMGGDGIYTYGGRDSKGSIQLGSPVG